MTWLIALYGDFPFMLSIYPNYIEIYSMSWWAEGMWVTGWQDSGCSEVQAGTPDSHLTHLNHRGGKGLSSNWWEAPSLLARFLFYFSNKTLCQCWKGPPSSEIVRSPDKCRLRQWRGTWCHLTPGKSPLILLIVLSFCLQNPCSPSHVDAQDLFVFNLCPILAFNAICVHQTNGNTN